MFAQSLLKRTGLFATLMIATAVSFMNVPVQAQTDPVSPTTPPKPRTTPVGTLASEAAIKVVRGQRQTASRETISLDMPCPTGSVVIGGGGNVSPVNVNAYLKSNSPILSDSGSPTGWRITSINLTDNNVTVNGYAVCAPLK